MRQVAVSFGLFMLFLLSQADMVQAQKYTGPKQLQSIPVWNYTVLNNTLLQRDVDSVFIINFWATWCKPCIEELPLFVRMDSILKATHAKAKVVLVSLDFEKDLSTKLAPYVAEHLQGMNIVLFHDEDMNGWIEKVAPMWSGAIPATLFVNHPKKHSTFLEQSFKDKELEQAFQQFLGE